MDNSACFQPFGKPELLPFILFFTTCSPYTPSMESLYIFGAGEFAQIACSYFTEEGKYDFKGFVIDDEIAESTHITVMGFQVHKYSEIVNKLIETKTKVFVAISATQMNKSRANVYFRLKAEGCRFATYISPMAFVSKHASIGENVFIFEENVVQFGASIANNTILWSGNHIGHQSKIGSHNFFSSHVVVSGFCSIGDYCYFGVNATLVDHLNIASGTLLGAGSLLLGNTENDSVYIGSPAKKLSGRDPYKVVFK